MTDFEMLRSKKIFLLRTSFPVVYIDFVPNVTVRSDDGVLRLGDARRPGAPDRRILVPSYFCEMPAVPGADVVRRNLWSVVKKSCRALAISITGPR